MTVLSASSIIGDNVVNAQGEDLGEIKDLMIDLNSGQVNYAVLKFGAFMGMGGKLFAVPLSAMTVNKSEKNFVFDQTKESLENAPGFDENDWPDFSNQSWSDSINDHYNVPRYSYDR